MYVCSFCKVNIGMQMYVCLCVYTFSELLQNETGILSPNLVFYKTFDAKACSNDIDVDIKVNLSLVQVTLYLKCSCVSMRV